LTGTQDVKRKPLRRIFGAFTFIFFDRRRSLAFCLLFVAASWLVEIHCRIPSLFADSGAVVTLAGLFLNIKHSLHFLRIPVDAGHQFRSMSGQDSGPCRATVPVDAGRGV
jgi:hypothetical protein